MKYIKQLICIMVMGFIFMNAQTSNAQVKTLEIPSGLESSQTESKSNIAKYTTLTKTSDKTQNFISITFDSEGKIVKITAPQKVKSNALVSGTTRLGVPCPHCITEDGYDRPCVLQCIWDSIFGSDDEK